MNHRFFTWLILALVTAGGGGGGGGGGNGGMPAPPPPPPPPPVDTTPDTFSFSPVTDAARDEWVDSESVTIMGLSAATDVSITGGEYSVDGGSYSGTSGTVSDGQTVSVRVRASSDFATETLATLTVGGVSADFRVTTIAAPTVLIDINADIRHVVGDLDSFDRRKYVTIHSSHTEPDWIGNNSQSRSAPNASQDLLTEFAETHDVYFGRDTGAMAWQLRQLPEDPNRTGFIDETAATARGNEVRRNYASSTNSNAVATRRHEQRGMDLIVGAQQHPYWPDGQTTSQGWAFSQADTPSEPFGTATGHYMGQFLSKYFSQGPADPEGQPKPVFVEVMNEPVYDLVDAADEPEDLGKIFRFHNAVAAAIRATNDDVLIGGYAAAFPDFEREDFNRWRERHKAFMDIAGHNMDFLAIHFYDWPTFTVNGRQTEQYRKGSNLEATLDMLEHYATLKFGAPMPVVVSEYGAQVHTLRNQPWTPMRDWLILKSVNSMLMAFLERPDIIQKTIPFITVKAEWGRISETVPYTWRLMRQASEAAGESGDEWVYTEVVKFYELWSDVGGTRVDSYATDPDVLVDAYIDDSDLFIIANNLEFEDAHVSVALDGLGTATAARFTIKHLYRDGDVPVLQTTQPAVLPESFRLGAESTVILHIEFDSAITLDQHSAESKHYAQTMLQPINASSTLSFDIDGVPTNGTDGEAVLRLGVGRAHGLSLSPVVSINGIAIEVPADFRGYDQYHDGVGRPSFFGVLEIPVPWTAMSENNRIDVTFTDSGGHVSSVALQVFNHSRTIARRAH